ncbi:Hypp9219 [Branchiostoma lanceolatum]|uniref:Hypp9219 protein n=1 Tax=Branchiostoma lanceolatum TaxID=7740 RepID=A0A8J9ZDV4_BRALA|nr:Hypp9219 [Branchiostoma lanceolatum]
MRLLRRTGLIFVVVLTALLLLIDGVSAQDSRKGEGKKRRERGGMPSWAIGAIVVTCVFVVAAIAVWIKCFRNRSAGNAAQNQGEKDGLVKEEK